MDEQLKNKDTIELEHDPHVVFYYNRNERLKRMPQSKKLYEGGFKQKSGVFRILTATKANRFLLISVFFLLAAVVFFGIIGNKPNHVVVSNIPIQLTAFLYEDTVYVTCALDEKNDHEGDTPVEIIAGTYDSAKNLIDSKHLFGVYSGSKQLLRTTFTDFEVYQVVALVKMFEKEYTVSVIIDRN